MMTTNIEYEIDLVTDYTAILNNELQRLGFPTGPDAEPMAICNAYHNLMRRLIVAGRRQIHKSGEFLCPEDYRAGLEATEKDITDGNDLTPRLSTLMKNIEYSDPMLDDWGVHHLHLGLTLDKEGFFERTKYLLFAMFTESDAYLIGVFRHGDWSKQNIIRFVHRNWPELIASSRLEGCVGIEWQASDEDIKTLRKAHINTSLEVEPGIVYCSIGGGSTGSGMSVEVVERSNRDIIQLGKYEKYIEDNIVEITETINQKIGYPLPKLQFNLVFSDGKLIVREYNTGLIITFKIK